MLRSQTPNPKFETFSLGINYQSNISRNEFNKYWLSDGGLEGFFSTPFYFGEAQFGLVYTSFSAKSDEQPDFQSFLFYLQWGYKFNLLTNFSFALNVSAGLFQMSFSDFDTDVDPGLLSERELALGVSTIFSYTFFSNWNLNLQVNYLHVFTNKKIEFMNLGIGVSKTFSSPQWLKDFFN